MKSERFLVYQSWLRAFGAVLTLLMFVLPSSSHVAEPTKGKHIVFLAGTKSHGPGDHEYEQACRLLARTLRAHDTSLKTTVVPYGWPDDP